MPPKKKAGKKEPPTKSQPNKADDDYIVFGNGPANKKRNDNEQQAAPPRPDTRKIIGGQSWTGKLPVNLLSEHCQREKWNKPEYSMRQVPSHGPERLYRSHVTISKTDPKTRETTTIPPFELPASHIQLADQPSALEARHFAAAYALFRVASMKNIHMALPPTYRDLWKGPFEQLKKEDVKEHRSWKYDADPFAADAKRKEIHVAMEKRRLEQEKKLAEKDTPGSTLPAIQSADARKWASAPRVELGENLRSQLESVITRHAVWNVHNTHLSDRESHFLVSELSSCGFRPSHVREALQYCGDRQEVLDWLLIHVPEDDLPPWALMAGYKAGVSLASGDVIKDAKLRRLCRAGYSSELCAQALRDNDGDELAALESLQAALVPSLQTSKTSTPEASDDVWNLELEAVSAVYDDRYATPGPTTCSITLENVTASPVILRFQKPSSGYPSTSVPVIAIDARLPAYIRLSATKQAVEYAWNSLLGEQMIFALVDWIETSLLGIIEDPGNLVDLEFSSTTFKLDQMSLNGTLNDSKTANQRQRLPPRQVRIDKRTNEEIRKAWDTRQASAAQQKMNASRASLPAWRKRTDITNIVASHQVTIITGDTGSGKSVSSRSINHLSNSGCSLTRADHFTDAKRTVRARSGYREQQRCCCQHPLHSTETDCCPRTQRPSGSRKMCSRGRRSWIYHQR